MLEIKSFFQGLRRKASLSRFHRVDLSDNLHLLQGGPWRYFDIVTGHDLKSGVVLDIF
jgi:hypothetical protein